ncbi:MAG: deoxyribose-phosphate aldolase [Bacteroidales bacterium]|jgi:deoxyribose-phosphate aldolase|nr:deoxyribose-phosphate aldolase [Bacteroidales bacterium]
MENLFSKYKSDFLKEKINQKVTVMANNSHQYANTETLKQIFSLIDLTSLNTEDNCDNISKLSQKVNKFGDKYPDMANVAAICIYPSMVKCVKENLKDNNINIAAVGAGFPSSQTFIEVKIAEVKKAVELGANEIDIVISVGELLKGNYEIVFNEIKEIKEAIGSKHLKVILETGALISHENIWKASILAIEAGADFIKTSTGKQEPAATLDAVYVMTKVIKDYYERTGKKIGIKPAGGISLPEDALGYYSIIKENLGEKWTNNKLFRIGASRLANKLLSAIYEDDIKYF